MFKFSNNSKSHLDAVHDDIRAVMYKAIEISPYDFGITCGLRTVAEQEELMEQGLSHTMESRHLTGHAVDFAVYYQGHLTWKHKYYRPVMQAIMTSAIELGIQVELGGLWKGFVDSPHVQLSWKNYPKEG